MVYWEKSTDYLEFDVSLYRGINEDKFEEKEWSLLIENASGSEEIKYTIKTRINLNSYFYRKSPEGNDAC